MIEYLRDQNAALVKERDSLAAELRALRKEHNALAAWKQSLAYAVPKDAIGFVSKRAEGRREVGRLEDIAGGPPYNKAPPDVLPTGGMSLNEVAQRFFENHDKGLDLYGRPTYLGVPVIADDSLPDGKIWTVPKGSQYGPGALEEVKEGAVLPPPKKEG